MSPERPESELSPEECIRAGMYWFGRNDFEAAESWWQKAIEIDPASTRARECLELLHRTSATGFKSATWASAEAPSSSSPFVNPQAPAASRRPYLEAEADEPDAPPPPSADLEDEPSGWMSDEPVILDPVMSPRSGRRFELSSPEVTTDPLEFASEGERFAEGSTPSSPDPWDEGSKEGSVVTVDTADDFDAVAEPTPLPELDRDRFFERYPRSREEIVDFLRATGDLPDLPPDIQSSEDVLDAEDEPVQAPAEDSSDPLQLARNKFALHDFDGVIDILEGFDSDHPDATEAASLIADARAQLLKMYESKIGDFNRTPRVLISGDEVIWLNLNHRAGFILSQIDGTVTFEDLTSLSGMSRLDTVKILAELLAQKVIAA